MIAPFDAGAPEAPHTHRSSIFYALAGNPAANTMAMMESAGGHPVRTNL
jgi:hypothetical protein